MDLGNKKGGGEKTREELISKGTENNKGTKMGKRRETERERGVKMVFAVSVTVFSRLHGLIQLHQIVVHVPV